MENYEYWYKKVGPIADEGTVNSLRGVVAALGSARFDLEQFERTGAAEAVTEMMEPVLRFTDEHDPASIAYWAKKGMVKEFHGEDVDMDWADYCARTGLEYDVSTAYTQNLHKKWTSFVPVSAFQPENKERKYPLLFVLHGAGNIIYTVDGWGFVGAAAEKEWIVVVPSLECSEVILEILAQAKALYPVDESRVYVTGFSYGSFNTNLLAFQHPDVFAAAAPCGGFFTTGEALKFPRRPGKQEPRYVYDGEKAVKKGLHVPGMSVIGSCDRDRFPVYDCAEKDDLLAGLNLWLRLNGLAPLTPAEVCPEKLAGGSMAQRLLGLPLEPHCGFVKTADGIDYVVGDFKDASGVTMLRVVCEENIPHWPTPELGRMVVEFFSHFSRDLETKESVYRT